MLDVAATREGFQDRMISDKGFVRSKNSLTDGPIKEMSQSLLRTVVITGHLDIQPEQWIIRSDEVTWVYILLDKNLLDFSDAQTSRRKISAQTQRTRRKINCESCSKSRITLRPELIAMQ